MTNLGASAGIPGLKLCHFDVVCGIQGCAYFSPHVGYNVAFYSVGVHEPAPCIHAEKRKDGSGVCIVQVTERRACTVIGCKQVETQEDSASETKIANKLEWRPPVYACMNILSF